MKNTPCPECNKLEGEQTCPEHKNVQIVKARICPIEDGTCPTVIYKISKRDNDPRHCGYDAHIIRAKTPEQNFEGIDTIINPAE
ncbi:MAG: hypothetical protein WCO07_01440 [bacterium]